MHDDPNDNNDEVENPELGQRAKLLAFQLSILNNHLKVNQFNKGLVI